MKSQTRINVIAITACVLMVLFAYGAPRCSQPQEPAKPAPIAVAPAPEAAPTPKAEPTAPAAPVVVTATSTPSAKATGRGSPRAAKRGGLSRAEYDAWLKGWRNAARARCLQVVVDVKIAGDIKLNTIREAGSVVTAPVCRDPDLLDRIAVQMLFAGELAAPSQVKR